MNGRHAKRLSVLPRANGALTRLAYAHATAGGIDPKPLLKKANLTLDQIEDPKQRLTVRDQIRFLNLAADTLPDDLLGFHLAQPNDLRELGLLYYVSASAEKMKDVLQQLARYASSANEGLSLQYLEGRQISVKFQYVGVSRHLDRHQIEFFTTLLMRLCRQLTGRALTPTRVRFVHRRDGKSPEFVKFFGGNVEFGASIDEIAFESAVKDMAVVSADHHLNKLLISYCEEARSRRPSYSGSFRQEVENAIVPLLPHGKARLSEAARRLGLSQRTLARRLSAEGLTFSKVLENLKADLGKHYLTDKNLSISQIAWLLGYREVSSLTHAFKRWTGKTPRDTRARRRSVR